MNTRLSNRLVQLGGITLLGTSTASAAFLEDGSANLQIRNFYFDRDFRSGTGQSQAQEWAQGFILRMNSGFTEGTVGFGLNLIGMAGYKLDSGAGRSGTGLLPVSADRKAQDEYSELGVAIKARISATELQVGTLQPLLPVILPVASRLFPPTFRGAYLNSREFSNLTLHAGYMDRINGRNSTDYQPMQISSPYGRFNAAARSTDFRFVGADYRFTGKLTGSYFHAQLEDLYQQHYLALLHQQPLGKGELKSDLRYFNSSKHGSGKAGRVDNQALSAMFTYQWRSHALGVGYLHLTGDTALPYLAGTDVNVNTEGALTSEFVNPQERVWQVRYDHDFAGWGVPGLRGMWRYIRGDHLRLTGHAGTGKEYEHGIELSYAVQSGPLQGLGIRLRHARNRNDFARDIDETRINLDYTFTLR